MANYNKLFGVFQRLHSDEEFEGTGAGLAQLYSASLCAMVGRVWGDSVIGQRCCIFLFFACEEKAELKGNKVKE